MRLIRIQLLFTCKFTYQLQMVFSVIIGIPSQMQNVISPVSKRNIVLVCFRIKQVYLRIFFLSVIFCRKHYTEQCKNKYLIQGFKFISFRSVRRITSQTVVIRFTRQMVYFYMISQSRFIVFITYPRAVTYNKKICISHAVRFVYICPFQIFPS